MQVSVIIPCYNSGAWLESTVRSAAQQTLPPLQIICIDDASENDTAERLERLREEIGDSLIILRQTERKGIGAARNCGLREAAGEWIALLDHDDLWLPRKLETQARLAAEVPDAALLHSRCWEQAGDDEASRSLMHDWKFMADAAPFSYLFLSNFIAPCTVLIRRDVLAQSGGFDERMDRLGKDDIDLWLRLTAEHHHFAHTEEPLAVRRLHDRNYSADPSTFLRGRYDVLLDAFERDLETARQLLTSEGILRLGGILFDWLNASMDHEDSQEKDRVRERLEDFIAASAGWMNSRTWTEKLVFGFPAFAPLAASLLKKNRRAEQRHQVECASCARDTLAHAEYIVSALGEAEALDPAFRELLGRAADVANRAARLAYRRRAEFEARYGHPFSSFS